MRSTARSWRRGSSGRSACDASGVQRDDLAFCESGQGSRDLLIASLDRVLIAQGHGRGGVPDVGR